MSVPGGILGRLCLFILLVISVPAYGDQRDLRLPQLFDRLRAASTSSEALLFSHLIGEIWQETENPQIHEPWKRALSAMEEENLVSASSLLDQVVEGAPDFAEGWNKRAEVYFLQGDFEASMRDSERTLALESRHFEAYFRLGLICVRLNEPAVALHNFKKTLAIYPYVRHLKQRVDDLQDRLAGQNI